MQFGLNVKEKNAVHVDFISILASRDKRYWRRGGVFGCSVGDKESFLSLESLDETVKSLYPP